MSNLKIANHNPGRKLFSSKIATVVVWVTTVIWTIPTLGLLVTSFKGDKDIVNEPWWVSLFNPKFTLSSYKGVLFGGDSESLSTGILPYFINSIAITCQQRFSLSLLQLWPLTLLPGSALEALTSSSSLSSPYKSFHYRCL